MATAKTATKAPSTVGNKQTEAIIGAAALKLNSATTAINASISAAQLAVAGLDEAIETKTLELVNLEAKKENLDTEYSQAKQAQDYKLDMEFKTNATKMITEFLESNGNMIVNSDEYHGLKKELSTLRADFQKQVDQERAIAKNTAEREANLKIKENELLQQAKESTIVAQLASKEEQINVLKEQVESWKTALDEERKAGVLRAQASSIGTVNLSSATK